MINGDATYAAKGRNRMQTRLPARTITMNGLNTRYRRAREDLGKIGSTVALAAALPKFFRERITLQQAEEEIKRLLEKRVERFLDLARTEIYERPGSPYLKLLKHAGCEFSDLDTQVRRHGLEATLVVLANAGVYLTSDEYKGKKDVVRAREAFRVFPGDFDQRNSSVGLTMQSSGTRNAPVRTFDSLDWVTLQVMGYAVFFSAHDFFSCAHALYGSMLAGRVHGVLRNAKLGIRTERWFARKVPVHGWLEEKYHYSTNKLIAKMGTWFGPGIAKPAYLDRGDVRPIVEWILEKKREGRKCCVRAVVSNAARIARVALDMGVSLEGTTFRMGAEPLTGAKRKLVEQAGARAAPTFAYGGSVNAGLGCGNPAFPDEVHVQQSLLALVERPKPLDYEGPPIHPLMLTTLHRSAPRLLLNVENGDYATMLRRDCGCPLEKAGFTQHLHTIRSFEKFTSEGMSYFGTDLFELLEHTLPSEFGGGPGDYQLVEEEEDNNGQTRLTLLVHPEIGNVDEQKVLARLQEGLAQGSRPSLFMAGVWQQAGTLRVRRQPPHASERGKILPLHILGH